MRLAGIPPVRQRHVRSSPSSARADHDDDHHHDPASAHDPARADRCFAAEAIYSARDDPDDNHDNDPASATRSRTTRACATARSRRFLRGRRVQAFPRLSRRGGSGRLSRADERRGASCEQFRHILFAGQVPSAQPNRVPHRGMPPLRGVLGRSRNGGDLQRRSSGRGPTIGERFCDDREIGLEERRGRTLSLSYSGPCREGRGRPGQDRRSIREGVSIGFQSSN